MFTPISLAGSNLWSLAGWTMVHFLWLGTLVAMLAFACRWLLRRASANTRYAIALSSLAILAALPVAIALAVHETPGPFEGEIKEITGQVVSVTPTEVELTGLVVTPPIQTGKA